MRFVSSFFVANGTILKKVGENQDPLTFEEVGQENGFMLYETGIDKLFTDPAKLEIAEIHDRAYIFVNQEPRGVLSRSENVKSMPLSVDVGDTLQILVENQGRIRAQCTKSQLQHCLLCPLINFCSMSNQRKCFDDKSKIGILRSQHYNKKVQFKRNQFGIKTTFIKSMFKM